MNQAGFRFPDNPNDPTGRHCSHPGRKYAWICRERAINIGEIEEHGGKGHSARLIIFSIAEEESFSKGRASYGGKKYASRVENLQGWIFLFRFSDRFPSKLYIIVYFSIF